MMTMTYIRIVMILTKLLPKGFDITMSKEAYVPIITASSPPACN